MELSSISIAITSLVGALFSPGAMFTTGINGAWYDPSDFSTMFQDAAGTTPVTAVGQPVGRILDKSGRGNNAFNPSGNSANFPVLQQDGTGRYCLAFNGINQWLQTNSIDFTYGDKMFVSAGVRKLSDATGNDLDIVVELSTASETSNGAFAVLSSNGWGGSQKTAQMNSRGTAIAAAESTNAAHAAPITYVLSGIGNISGDQSVIRVNGTQAASSLADQGTGNYGAYPLFLGARGGVSNWFNGPLYGLVVAGKQASASEIASIEAWLNQKTGAY